MNLYLYRNLILFTMAIDPTKNYDGISSLVLLTMENNALFNTLLDQVAKLRIENSDNDIKEAVNEEIVKSLEHYRNRATDFLVEKS